MKLSTVLLSSAALLVAGAAYAADLPAKKAAPAAAPTGCATFGGGFFSIPGSDNCLKISGHARFRTYNQYATGTTPSVVMDDNIRLNFDVRSNTDAGVARAFGRLNNGAMSYAYVQIGGLSAGRQDAVFAGYYGDVNEVSSSDYGSQANAISYTASLGGNSTFAIGLEDQTNSSNMANYTLSKMPDIDAKLTVGMGNGASVYASAVSHQLNSNAGGTGATYGYAGQIGTKIAASKDTTLYAQATYAYGALDYLGASAISNNTNTSIASTLTVYDANTGLTTINSGYAAMVAISQTVGSGKLNGIATYYGITDNANTAGNGVGTYNSAVGEINYQYTGIKSITIAPAIAVNQITGLVSSSSVLGFLRIQKDF